MYVYLWCFLFMSFIGWLCEVGYAAVIQKKFVNRGFLNGPYCPIYGAGILVMDLALSPIKANVVVLILGAMLLGSIVEWIAGFLLERIFKQKWWDYSNHPYNLNGYICLSFSLVWGIMGTIVVRGIIPLFKLLIPLIPQTVGITLLILLFVLFLTDLAITTVSILGLNRKLKNIQAISEKLREGSDYIGKAVSEGVLDIQERYNESELKERYEEFTDRAHKEAEEWKVKYQQQLAQLQNNRIQVRLIKAFPTMRSRNYNEQLVRSASSSKFFTEKSSEAMKKRNERAISAYKADPTNQNEFAPGFSPIKLLWIFMLITLFAATIEWLGKLIISVVYQLEVNFYPSPFLPFYGIVVVLLTVCLYQLHGKRDIWIFICGTLYTGLVIFLWNILGQLVSGTFTWRSFGVFTCIEAGNRLFYALFGGLLSIFWMKDIYPLISKLIGRINQKAGYIITACLALYFCITMVFAAGAVNRWAEREKGIPAQNEIQRFYDPFFENAFPLASDFFFEDTTKETQRDKE